MKKLRPGDTIGILGGGQLGRMLAIAAAQLGLKTHIFAPENDSPAFEVAAFHTCAAYTDQRALSAFARGVAVITYEFENVPAETAAFLAALCPVYPDVKALKTSQDRLAEKTFLRGLGIATAPFADVEDADALARAVAQIGRPAILKSRRFGYDGKGQAMIREGADLSAVFRSIGGQPAILEGVVPFTREISIIAARGKDGAFKAFDACENTHEHHILARTTVPAKLSAQAGDKAVGIARLIASALDYVGVIAVEMFATDNPRAGIEDIAVNEFAPRVHNSGHWTIEGAATSQFAQHIRAVCGWPLGSVKRYGAIEMRNLIGAEAGTWVSVLGQEGASLHIYGKGEARAGRKMGHVTRVG